MTAYARVLIFLLLAALVVAPRTSRAGESEDADRALFIKYCAACHGEDGKGGSACHEAPGSSRIATLASLPQLAVGLRQ
jgi:cytochrome c553